MSKRWQCDRCGKHANGTPAMDISIYSTRGHDVRDLCSDCTLALIDWIDDYPKERRKGWWKR